MTNAPGDKWVTGDAYEAYMGRWSRPVARAFIAWLNPERSASWIEVGSGTGALTSTICDLCEPASVVACDPSEAFIEHARRSLPDARVSFIAGRADVLPFRDGGFDAAVSGLVLNFLPNPAAALAAVRERLRRGGTVANFDDYWMPFLRGTGPAPGYVASLDPDWRELLRSQLERRLPTAHDGRIALRARAWAVRGVSP